MFRAILKAWITWRYGGLPAALKPPIGWPPWTSPPIAVRVRYGLAKALWMIESWLYRKLASERYIAIFGGPGSALRNDIETAQTEAIKRLQRPASRAE
jgi:hypothetical protein